MKKLLKGILLSTVLMLSVAGCGGTTDKEPNPEPSDATTDATSDSSTYGLIEDGVIHVATSPDYPPFEFIEGEDITGFDIELFDALASNLGLTTDYEALDFEMIVTAVQSGQFDVGASGFTITDGREVTFTDSYYSSSQVALLPIDSDIQTNDDLAGKKLGAGLGTVGLTIAEDLSDSTEVLPTSTAFPALKQGQLDAYICDLAVAQNAIESGGLKVIEEPIQLDNFGFIVEKGNIELANTLNAELAKFKLTPEYAELLAKYNLDK